MTTATTAPIIQDRMFSKRKRLAAAASIGTVLEVYDWVLLGIFALPISRTFFPSSSETAALLLTLATVAVGVLVRPLGAILLGRLADRTGRSQALSASLLLMGLGILISALCPSYASIGLAAPIIMVIGRILQGLSAGGELGTALTVLVESAPPKQRRLLASLLPASQSCGTLLAGLVGVSLTYFFSEQQLLDGAWRIAFLIGLLIVPVGFYLRREMGDAHTARPSKAVESGWAQTVKYRGALFYGVFIVLFWTVATYASNYFAIYATRQLGLPFRAGYLGQMVIGFIGAAGAPLVGLLAAKVGIRRPMFIGCIGTLVLAYPMLWYLNQHPSVGTLLLVQSIQMALLICFAVGASAELADLFEPEFRATGTSVSYTAAVTIFGGLSPMIITALIDYTGNKLAFGIYLAAAALISTCALLIKGKPREDRQLA